MDINLSYGSDYHAIPAVSLESGASHEVSSDLLCFTVQIVNVVFAGHPDRGEWVLVDAGMPDSADRIISAANNRFGANGKPKAILLTHGHFDHVGAIIELIEHWDVPVYAHELEMPYLTGKRSYPSPDPAVEGGFVAKMSPMFPVEPINLGRYANKLPSDGTVPGMPGWCWIHTPGHTPGHVSFFRDADRTLIAGDAFVTVRQDSLYKVLIQEQEISGPPRYLTPDWQAAKESVHKLTALKPSAAVTGHGLPVSGDLLAEGLRNLDRNFDRFAVPDYGKYVQ